MTNAPHRSIARAVAFGLSLLLCASCGNVVRQGRGSSYLIIDSLTASPGGNPSQVGNTLQSDVYTKQIVFDDGGYAVLRFAMKDVTITSPSTNNEITLTSYHVSFARADGRNTPGVDVPYAFDGALTGTIKSGGTLPVNYTIVRAQAKIEPPLLALRGMGGAILISTVATVTFDGHDQVGNEVSVSGTMSVTFADWGDPA